MKMETPPNFHDPRIVVLALMTLLAISSCQEDTPTSCPDYDVGALQGYLLSVGQGVSKDIQARQVEGELSGRHLVSTTSDSTGYFRFDLPSGLYRLAIRPDAGHPYSWDQRDTVRVRQKIRRYDLWKGRMEVRVGVPEEFEGQVFRMRLQSPLGGSSTEEAIPQSGNLLFVFPVLAPRSYMMKMSLPGGGDLYLPGTYEQSEAYSQLVGTDEVAHFQTDFSNSYASVSGTVTGSWMQVPGGRMEIVISTADDYDQISKTQCEDDGSFTCGVFIPGQVKIGTLYRYDHLQWIGGDSFETAQVFDIQPGDRLTDIAVFESGFSVGLEGPGDLIGYQPTLHIRSEDGLDFEQNLYGNNPYYFCNLRPGRYYVHLVGYCRNQIWAPQWYGGSEDFEGAEAIDLAAGELHEITMDLVEGGRIEGEIRDQNGRIPEGARYKIYDVDGVSLCGSWNGWSGDRMLFSGLPNGTYLVAATGSGYLPWFYPGTLEFAEATQIVVENHQTVAGLVWTLPVDAKEGTP